MDFEFIWCFIDGLNGVELLERFQHHLSRATALFGRHTAPNSHADPGATNRNASTEPNADPQPFTNGDPGDFANTHGNRNTDRPQPGGQPNQLALAPGSRGCRSGGLFRCQVKKGK